jgi:hypothetical protein
MGPYCKYCDTRCFLPRRVGDRTLLMATCHRGMEHDRASTGGHDHRTTLNPVTGETDIKVQLRTSGVVQVCTLRTTDCTGGIGWVIPVGQEYAAVTTRADQHDRALLYHLECLTLALHLDARAATPPTGELTTPPPPEPAPAPATTLVRNCPDCGGSDLTWSWTREFPDGIADGRLFARDVRPLFYLGCDGCSATIAHLDADQVATLLTRHELRPTVPAAATR